MTERKRKRRQRKIDKERSKKRKSGKDSERVKKQINEINISNKKTADKRFLTSLRRFIY